MAEPTFDRRRFASALATRWIGRNLVVRASVGSTNDVCWDLLAAGAPDGMVVVADEQTSGRGREGRHWSTPPGLGLALSVLLRPGCERHALSVLPLGVGLALARGLETLGASTELKWPNDLLARGRKISGILCERRRIPSGDDVVVAGVGVNVFQTPDDFPEDVRARATSLALEGVAADREAVAAAFVNAFEPLWTEMDAVGTTPIVEAWQGRAAFWGERLTVRTPSGDTTGIARGLAEDGALLLTGDTGSEIRVVAGDVQSHAGAARPGS